MPQRQAAGRPIRQDRDLLGRAGYARVGRWSSGARGWAVPGGSGRPRPGSGVAGRGRRSLNRVRDRRECRARHVGNVVSLPPDSRLCRRPPVTPNAENVRVAQRPDFLLGGAGHVRCACNGPCQLVIGRGRLGAIESQRGQAARPPQLRRAARRRLARMRPSLRRFRNHAHTSPPRTITPRPPAPPRSRRSRRWTRPLKPTTRRSKRCSPRCWSQTPARRPPPR